MNFDYLRFFKYIGFMSSHYVSTINLDVLISLSVFNKFNFMYQSNVLLILIEKKTDFFTLQIF